MPTTMILPSTFEQERNDLLAQYEGSPAFRPAGDYTTEQFEGRRRTYYYRLMDLLDRYAHEYPHLRDALGLELSRSRHPKHGTTGAVAYEFDGLLLPERLARRVGRLKLPPDARLFPALDPLNAGHASPVARQQRYHYARALALAHQLAHAATRAVLTTPAVMSALQCLRAFGFSDNQMQQNILGSNPTPALATWWKECGLNDDRGALRTVVRTWQKDLFSQYENTRVEPLNLEQARAQLQVAATGKAFSPAFYARYFACAALPVLYHDTAARICLGVAALYALPKDALTASEQKAALNCLRELTTAPYPDYVAAGHAFFEELSRQPSPGGPDDRLARHLALGRWAKAPGLLYDFYQAVGTHLDAEEETEIAEQLQLLAQAVETTASLALAGAELAACAAGVCRTCYERLQFQSAADQQTLRQLYPLLLPGLLPEEATVLEDSLLDQAIADAEQANQWLAGSHLLAQRLRERLRERLAYANLTVGCPVYSHLRKLLVVYSPALEVVHNHELFARRYDTNYFMCLAQ